MWFNETITVDHIKIYHKMSWILYVSVWHNKVTAADLHCKCKMPSYKITGLHIKTIMPQQLLSRVLTADFDIKKTHTSNARKIGNKMVH